MAKKYIWVVIALIIIGGGYYWYQKTHPASKPIQYITAAAEKGTLAVSVSGSGQVEAISQVDLKPVVAGDAIDVINVYVKNDQTVKKGDLIALLDPEDAQKAVRNAEVDLASAKNKYTQVKKDDTSDKYDKKSQKLAVEQKENTLADAKAKLSDYYVRAPFGGVVTALSVNPGDSVSRSDVLASVITNDVHAKVVLNEIDAIRVRIGDKATLKFDALPETGITGKVTKIDTIGTVSQGVVTYNAEIFLDTQNNLLKPGMSVSASVISDTKSDVLMVPVSAVKSDANGSYVEVLNGGTTPQRKNVQVGASNSEFTEISGDIKADDKVVTQTIDPNATTTSSSAGGGLGGGAFRALH